MASDLAQFQIVSESEFGAEKAPRYELFHAASSICSQKVRMVLAHHALPYGSRDMNMFVDQTYLPGYVRLRVLGEQYGAALVFHHTGSTSAAAHGCDGAVGPTLVDWATGEVVVDSHRICLYLAPKWSSRRGCAPGPWRPLSTRTWISSITYPTTRC